MTYNEQSKSQSIESNDTEPRKSLKKEDLDGSSVVDPTLVRFHEFIRHFTDNNLAINLPPLVRNRIRLSVFLFQNFREENSHGFVDQ